MPLTELTTTGFSHSCAACGAVHTFSLADVTPEDTSSGDHLLRLPECGGCGSVELLVPLQSDPDALPDVGGYGHLHRLMVEELDERVTPARASAARAQKRTKWFPKGFTLAPVFEPPWPGRKKGTEP